MKSKQKNIWEYLLYTEESSMLIFLRLALGIVMFAHGAQKLFGWFGGYGFNETMKFMTGSLGIPALFAFFAIIIESIGSLFLIGGFLSRIFSLGIGVIMIVAVLTSHIQNGFFMNWGGNAAGEGFEYHILVFAIALTLMIKGGGGFSIDLILHRKLKEKEDNYEIQHAHS